MKTGIGIIDLARRTSIQKKYTLLKAPDRSNTPMHYPDKKAIAKLLMQIKEHNPYYKSLLRSYSNYDISCDPMGVFNMLPIIDKQTVNEHYKLFHKPVGGRKMQRKKTGGSTGNPFYYYVDNEHLSWFWAYIYFFWNKNSGYEPGDPFITVAGSSLSTGRKKFVENTYHWLQNNYFIPGDVINPKIRLNCNRIEKAVLLYGYPSSIINLLKIKQGFARMAKNMKAIFTTSEQLLPQQRQIIESAFNLPVYDMYGANDGGILTCECAEHNGYHINIRNCYVETFTNEFGMSELLLTNLNSYGFPLVRYRVGDLGRIETGECGCGLNWPRITELKGRTRDVIKLIDGTAIHGSLFNKVFYRYEEIDGYKIVQNKNLSIMLYIHLKVPASFEGIREELIKDFTEIIGNIDLTIDLMQQQNPTNDKFKLIESHAV